jgi:hypothetical protein
MAFYRYVDGNELVVVQANLRVPNRNRAGRPKTVYFTDDYYTSAATAEADLQIGQFHPNGPFPAPTHRLDLDLTNCFYTYHGIVPNGAGTEFQTPDSPAVTAITGLGP